MTLKWVLSLPLIWRNMILMSLLSRVVTGAEDLILTTQPDLVLLDIMLPGKDGMTICRDLRHRWQGPIVLLTSLDSDMKSYSGAGDGRLRLHPQKPRLRPFCWRVCAYTCGKANKRNRQKSLQESALTPHKALRFGALTIDPLNRAVQLNGDFISLSTADFELLWELATHAGQIMDRDALLKTLRGVNYDGLDRERGCGDFPPA